MDNTIVVAARRDEPAARDALALAVALARLEDACLVVAAAWMSPPHLAGPYDEAVRLQVEHDLEPLLKRIPADVPFEVKVRRCVSAPAGLHRIAVDAKAEMIVLGPKTMGDFHRHATPALVHDAGFALAVAPAGFASREVPADVVVGWDGSREAEIAVTVGQALAADTGGELRVVRAACSSVRAELDPDHVEQLDGRPSSVLTRIADEDAWIVVGSRGRGFVRRTLFGSTTTAVLERARVPVLVVPHGVTRAAGRPQGTGAARR